MAFNHVKDTIFVFLTGLGTAGNIFVLVNYIYVFGSSERKSTHLVILIHLTFTNILMLFSKGTPRTIASFGLRILLGDIGCKAVVFLERVARGLSISTTSLLTVVQAITISPRASKWRALKPRSAWHVLPLLAFLWILNSLISMNLPFYIKKVSNMNSSEINTSEKYCYFLLQNLTIRWIFVFLMFLRDAVFQVVMSGASGYMVLLLHKHHQHVLYLQTAKLLYRTPPEMKAAKSVLLLMLCFLSFYWTDCFISLYTSFSLHKDFIVQEFVTLGFSILSPFVLLHRDRPLAEHSLFNKRETP